MTWSPCLRLRFLHADGPCTQHKRGPLYNDAICLIKPYRCFRVVDLNMQHLQTATVKLLFEGM